MANFKISASPGGSQTKTGVAIGDLWPTVDISVGASDNANKTATTGVTADIVRSVRQTVDAMKTPPLATDIGTTWTWLNQGSATGTQDAAGAFVLSTPASTDQVRGLIRSIPATPFSMTIELSLLAPAANYAQISLLYMDSGTGKIVALSIGSSTTDFAYSIEGTQADKWTNSTTYGAAYATLAPRGGITNPTHLRLTDNGTNIIPYVSKDGVNFYKLGAGVSRTDYLATPDKIGFGINAGSASYTDNLQMIVKDFYIS